MKTGTFVLALGAALLVALLGWALARARAGQADAYGRERAAQRRAVAATRRPAPGPGAEAPAGKSACVTGLDTFATAIERALLPLPDGPGRRVAALKAISDAAVRAERTAELARPAPTLPQRMGLEHGQPIAPEKRACDGRGYAELR